MKTSIGVRQVDGIFEGTTINNTKNLFESKVGFQEYRGNLITQVEKDFELLSTGKVQEITWVFYRSPNTGKVGASKELLQELDKAGIKTVISGDIPKDIIDKAIMKYAPTTK